MHGIPPDSAPELGLLGQSGGSDPKYSTATARELDFQEGFFLYKEIQKKKFQNDGNPLWNEFFTILHKFGLFSLYD